MAEQIAPDAVTQDLVRPVIAVRADERHTLKHFTILHHADVREARVPDLAELSVVIHEDQLILRHHAAGMRVPMVLVRVRQNDRVALQNLINRKRQLHGRIALHHVHRFREPRELTLIGKHRVNQERRPAKRHLNRGAADQLDRAAFIDGFHRHFYSPQSLFFNGSRGKHFSRSSP